jgi:hypothetical protein
MKIKILEAARLSHALEDHTVASTLPATAITTLCVITSSLGLCHVLKGQSSLMRITCAFGPHHLALMSMQASLGRRGSGGGRMGENDRVYLARVKQ